MKHLLAAGALLFALALDVRAAGPDDQYLGIYYVIQQADTFANAGNNAEAAPRYQDALRSLQQLQRAYPTWQTNVVSYRINYLASKITTTAAALPSKPAVDAASSAALANPELQNQLATLQAQLGQLQADNSTLQSKLRESLAAQPAATDPRELARAEQRIKDIAKENDLLKASLVDAQAKAGASANTRQVAQLRKELDEANRQLAAESARAAALANERGELQNKLSKVTTSPRDADNQAAMRRQLDETSRKLAEQTATADQLTRDKSGLESRLRTLETEAASAGALRAENDLLRKQVADLKSAPPVAKTTADLTRRLAAAEAQIAALQSERDILQLERGALENRVRQLMVAVPVPVAAPPVARAEDNQRIQQLAAERDDLQKQLAAANKELANRKSAPAAVTKADDLAAQLAVVRAKLDVYEAKPVPYTAEELALFRQAPVALAPTDAPVRKNYSNPKPPPGSSVFIIEAQRHFVAREFDQAEASYEKVLRKDDKNVYTLANLAAIQLEAGKLVEAEKNLKQALALAPDDAYSLQTLGYLKFREEKYDEAFAALSRAAQLSPDSAEIQNYLGVTLGHKGQRIAAESALRKAIVLEPGYASAHNNLAVIYATQEKPALELARWHYQKALAGGHPKNPELEKLFDQKAAAPTPP